MKQDKKLISKEIYILMFCGQIGSNMISENAINNNSLVCKLNYKKFSMLFTGDIEEIAEKSILQRYSKKELNSIVLKIAHHRFKNIINKRFFRCGKAAICINWGRKR